MRGEGREKDAGAMDGAPESLPPATHGEAHVATLPYRSGAHPDVVQLARRLPPLPVCAARLLADERHPHGRIEALVDILSADSAVASNVLQTINSAMFGLRHPVLSVRHAAALLGPRALRSIALSFAMMEAIPVSMPVPFDRGAFRSDALMRALFARSFAERRLAGERERAFMAALLADAAVPFLADAHSEYADILEQWRRSERSLADLERAVQGWDHAAAGAFLLESWGFPRDLVCAIGVHASPLEDAQEEEERDSSAGTPAGNLATIVAIAAMVPSARRSPAHGAKPFVRAAMAELGYSAQELVRTIARNRSAFEELRGLFHIDEPGVFPIFNRLVAEASLQEELLDA